MAETSAFQSAIIAAARAAIGTPFRHQGRIAGRSLDCAGLAVHVAREIGADHFDIPAYGRSPSNGMLQAALDAQPCLRVVPDRQPGDLLLMRFAGEPQHLAFLTADDTIVHTYANAGKVCEHRLAAVWAARIVRVYRFSEISSGAAT